jgi:hypothetical protein
MGIKIKWGVLGSGGIARRRTIPEGIAYAKNAVLSSVYDLNSEVNSTVAKEFKTTAAQSVEDLSRLILMRFTLLHWQICIWFMHLPVLTERNIFSVRSRLV